jgi:hypothetical protein
MSSMTKHGAIVKKFEILTLYKLGKMIMKIVKLIGIPRSTMGNIIAKYK